MNIWTFDNLFAGNMPQWTEAHRIHWEISTANTYLCSWHVNSRSLVIYLFKQLAHFLSTCIFLDQLLVAPLTRFFFSAGTTTSCKAAQTAVAGCAWWGSDMNKKTSIALGLQNPEGVLRFLGNVMFFFQLKQVVHHQLSTMNILRLCSNILSKLKNGNNQSWMLIWDWTWLDHLPT